MIGVSLGDIVKLLEKWPAWQAVADLPKRLRALEERITALEAALAERPAKSTGPACPLCGEPMKTKAVQPDPIFGDMGVQAHTLACTACAHVETRQVDPRRV